MHSSIDVIYVLIVYSGRQLYEHTTYVINQISDGYRCNVTTSLFDCLTKLNIYLSIYIKSCLLSPSAATKDVTSETQLLYARHVSLYDETHRFIYSEV